MISLKHEIHSSVCNSDTHVIMLWSTFGTFVSEHSSEELFLAHEKSFSLSIFIMELIKNNYKALGKSHVLIRW